MVLEVIRSKIWKYAKSLDMMTKSDQILVKILDKSRFMLFSIFLLDLTLYTFNAVTHHDITKPQSGPSIQSFIVSNIVASCIIGEVIHMILLNSKFRFIKKKTAVEKKIEQNSIILEDGENNLKSKTTEEHSPSSEEVKYESYYNFYSNGIKPEVMNKTKVAKYYNLISLIRLVSFEPILVTLQLIPEAQITIILILQMVMCIFTIIAVFKFKIFKNILFTIQNFVFETLLTGVLGIFFMMSLQNDGSKMNSSQTWRTIQSICIVMICTIALTNIVVTVIGIFTKIKTNLAEKKALKDLKNKGMIINQNEAEFELNERPEIENIKGNRVNDEAPLNIVRPGKKPMLKKYSSKLKGSKERIMKKNKKSKFNEDESNKDKWNFEEKKQSGDSSGNNSGRSGSDPDSSGKMVKKSRFDENPYLKDEDVFDFGDPELKKVKPKKKRTSKGKKKRKRADSENSKI